MSKKSAHKSAKKTRPIVTAADAEFSEHFADPSFIFDAIEHKSTATDDAYRRRIDELMASGLKENGDVDEIGDAQHIRATLVGLVLETAARRAGFILGFEFCRKMLTLELKGSAA